MEAAEFWRWQWRVTSLWVLALAITSCSDAAEPTGRSGDRVDPTPPTAETIEAPTTVAPPMPSERSADFVRQGRKYQFPDPLGSLQRTHGVAPAMLPPGEHVADSLGIEVTLRLDRWWRLEGEEPGSFALTRPDAPVAGLLPAIAFYRPVGLAPVNRVSELDLYPGEHTVSPDDLGGWLDDVDQIEVLARGEFTVGERHGAWFDIDVVDDRGPLGHDCNPGHCVDTWWSGGSPMTVARDLESLRYYTFPDPEGPIYVLVAAADDEFDEWNSLATELLESVSFGPSAPHPVPSDISAGLERAHEPGTELSFVEFPEVTFSPEVFSISGQRPGVLVLQRWRDYGFEARPELVRPDAELDGTTIATVEDVERLLVGAGLRRLGDEFLLDGTQSVFDGAVDGAILRRAELEPGDDPAFVAWPEFGRTFLRAWVIDGPRGPLILSATTSAQYDRELAVNQATEMMSWTTLD